MLLDKAKDEQQEEAAPGWIALFYEIVTVFIQGDFSFETRYELFQSNNEADIPTIGLNLEEFLSKLHAWSAGMLDATLTLNLMGGTELTIVKKDLERLIKEITGSLTVLLDLPKSGIDDGERKN